MSVEFQEFYAKEMEICLPGVLATFIYLLDSGRFEGPGIADDRITWWAKNNG